jgi:hypothetical protein
MNVKIRTETAQFPKKEYINGIFVAVQCSSRTGYSLVNRMVHATLNIPQHRDHEPTGSALKIPEPWPGHPCIPEVSPNSQFWVWWVARTVRPWNGAPAI